MTPHENNQNSRERLKNKLENRIKYYLIASNKMDSRTASTAHLCRLVHIAWVSSVYLNCYDGDFLQQHKEQRRASTKKKIIAFCSEIELHLARSVKSDWHNTTSPPASKYHRTPIRSVWKID